MEQLKICTRCNIIKERIEFRIRTGPKANKDGLNATCRKCDKELSAIYKLKKKEENPLIFCYICQLKKHYMLFYKDKKSIDKNGHKCIDCIAILKQQVVNKKDGRRIAEHKNGQKQCSKCKLFIDCELFWKSKYTTDGFYSSCIRCTIQSRLPRKEKNKRLVKKWMDSNKEYMRQYHNEYSRNRYANDIGYRLRKLVNNAILYSIKNYSKNMMPEALIGAIFMYLPYTAQQLKEYLESLFESWMNWDNHGKYNTSYKTWQIDHVISQSKLPFTDFNDDNFKNLWQLSNLRPLETIANIKKGNK